MPTSSIFHASISPKFIDKVTRLFNSSTDDICHLCGITRQPGSGYWSDGVKHIIGTAIAP